MKIDRVVKIIESAKEYFPEFYEITALMKDQHITILNDNCELSFNEDGEIVGAISKKVTGR